MKNMELKSFKSKLLEMLSRREYSKVEAERKLIAWIKRKQLFDKQQEEGEGSEPHDLDATMSEIQKTLDEFEAKGWLSDERYVESFLNQKAARLGNGRLKQELKNKGVNEEVVLASLEELSCSELKRAHEVWERKFRTLPTDPKSYQKQMRFLVYRGFGVESVKKILAGSNIDLE